MIETLTAAAYWTAFVAMAMAMASAGYQYGQQFAG